MNIYFLRENPYIKGSAVKKIMPPQNTPYIDIPPLSKLKEKRKAVLTSRLLSFNALYFASGETEEALPQLFKSDPSEFFYLSLPEVMKKLKDLVPFERPVLFDSTGEYAIYFLRFFPDMCLSGKDAFASANYVFLNSGASVPILSDASLSDAAVFCTDKKIIKSRAAFHPDFKTAPGFFGTDSLLCRPKGKYSFIFRTLKAPLSAASAARLFAFDNKAEFDFSFKNPF